MPDSRTPAREAALTEWADDARSRGHRVPDTAVIARISDTGLVGVAGLDPVVDSWRPTIEWLLNQVKFSISDPHHVLPDDLRSPAASSPEAKDDGEQVATPLTALQRWRQASIERDVPGIGQLKDTHLRNVANSRWRTEEEIRAAFPPVVGSFAEDIARVLREFAQPVSVPRSDREAPATPPAPSAPPAPAPAPEPAPAPTAPAPSATTEVDPAGFAPFAYGSSPADPVTLAITTAPDGSTRISWPKADSGADSTAVYRVVAADDYAPFNPDQARSVAATTALSATDSTPFSTAVRYYQAWRHEGPTVGAAQLEQPVLHATGAVVAPVVDLDLREDEGRVIGQGRVLDGTQRVQVLRVPIRSAATGLGDPQYRIAAGQDNFGGFVDSGAARGERYIYQVFAEASVDGITRLSSPSVVDLTVSIVHEPVVDLSFDLHDDAQSPFFNLSWSQPPGGRVVIYRSTKPPMAGIEQGAQPEAVLEQANLRLDDRLAHPLSAEGDRGFMRDVPWPREWTRAYFTPVVLQGGAAYVGNTVRGVRVPPVTRPQLVERVNRAVLTFDWPEGADAVRVYTGPVGGDAEAALQGPPTETSYSSYKARGGISFPAGTLESRGCDLHLVSIAFDGGQPVTGTPVTLNYPAILRLAYTLTSKYSLLGKLTFGITVDAELDANVPLVLVYNAARLPLSVSDGTPVAVVRADDEGATPERRFLSGPLGPTAPPSVGWRTDSASWQRDVPAQTGFVRLFVDLPTGNLRHIALLDPPVAKMRVLSALKRSQGVFGG